MSSYIDIELQCSQVETDCTYVHKDGKNHYTFHIYYERHGGQHEEMQITLDRKDITRLRRFLDQWDEWEVK